MKFLVITQGAPGAGKSTFASRIADGDQSIIFSADDYHYVEQPVAEESFEEGSFSVQVMRREYRFDPKKAGEAHKWNQERVRQALLSNESMVIVANTNTQAWEAKPYVEMAVACGYTVVFAKCEGRFQNVHGVPAEKVKMMHDRIEPLSLESCLAAAKPVRMGKWERMWWLIAKAGSIAILNVLIAAILFGVMTILDNYWNHMTADQRNSWWAACVGAAIIGYTVYAIGDLGRRAILGTINLFRA